MAKERRTAVAVSRWDMPYGYDPREVSLLDRLIAASAHLAILLSLPGLVYAVVLWVMLRGRAPFIARHARQGVLWQLVTNVVLVAVLLVLFLVALFSFGTTLNSGNGIVGLFGSLLGFFVVLVLGVAVAVGAAIIGAIFAMAGRPFRYPFLNRRSR